MAAAVCQRNERFNVRTDGKFEQTRVSYLYEATKYVLTTFPSFPTFQFNIRQKICSQIFVHASTMH
jgi:hypothetical protein